MAESEPHDPHNQLIPPHEIEHYENLFKAEGSFMADPDYLKNAKAATLRGYAVSCIEDYSNCESFDAFIPYLAMTYFDRVISRHGVMRLLNNGKKNDDLFVICCLTIAWKLRTKSFKLPKFLEAQKKDYQAKDVMKMELYILNQLGWRMRSLTPISFAEYFISFLMLREDQISLTRRLVRQVIITSQADIRTTSFKPSVVAAYVVSAISLKLFPSEPSRFEVALSRCRYANTLPWELSSCKKALQNICEAKLESLMSPAPEEETSKKAPGAVGTSETAGGTSVPAGGTSEPTGGTSEPTGATSSSLQASLPPGANTGKKSEPMQIGGDPPGTIELSPAKRIISSFLLEASIPPVATTEDRAAGRRPMEETQPAPTPEPGLEEDRATSSSLQASLPPGANTGKTSEPIQIGGDPPGTSELSTAKHIISSFLLEASMPPIATTEDRAAGKRPMEETQPAPTPEPGLEEDRAAGKRPMEEIQPVLTPELGLEDTQQFDFGKLLAHLETKAKFEDSLKKAKQPKHDEIQPEPKPAPTGTEDMQLDFQLEWRKYQELPSETCLAGLSACCPNLTACNTADRCLFL